jgi:CelD/BcsL family acetyltransferase involved in cellulose biosynthesis
MVYTFNPLHDRRWPEFVARHPHASVFHGTGWLDALWRTYGYEPVVYSTSPPDGELTNGLLFCRVNSPITGRRLVSLPFTDHCEPLVEEPSDQAELAARLIDAIRVVDPVKYVELRPRTWTSWSDSGAKRSESFAFHVLDLQPPLEQIFARIQKATVQRKIRRAERDSVSYEAGRSEALLKKFYQLLLQTRRRHMLPPQPVEWFRNLLSRMGDHLTIRVASKDGRAIAAILTLSWRDTMVYKYGGSDARYHPLGAMPLLLWRAIEEAKAQGLESLDLGRSDLDNPGLITFKDRWGAARSDLTYVRYSRAPTRNSHRGPLHGLQRAFAYMPDRMLVMAGKLLYRHLG